MRQVRTLLSNHCAVARRYVGICVMCVAREARSDGTRAPVN